MKRKRGHRRRFFSSETFPKTKKSGKEYSRDEDNTYQYSLVRLTVPEYYALGREPDKGLDPFVSNVFKTVVPPLYTSIRQDPYKYRYYDDRNYIEPLQKKIRSITVRGEGKITDEDLVPKEEGFSLKGKEKIKGGSLASEPVEENNDKPSVAEIKRRYEENIRKDLSQTSKRYDTKHLNKIGKKLKRQKEEALELEEALNEAKKDIPEQLRKEARKRLKERKKKALKLEEAFNKTKSKPYNIRKGLEEAHKKRLKLEKLEDYGGRLTAKQRSILMAEEEKIRNERLKRPLYYSKKLPKTPATAASEKNDKEPLKNPEDVEIDEGERVKVNKQKAKMQFNKLRKEQAERLAREDPKLYSKRNTQRLKKLLGLANSLKGSGTIKMDRWKSKLKRSNFAVRSEIARIGNRVDEYIPNAPKSIKTFVANFKTPTKVRLHTKVTKLQAKKLARGQKLRAL